MVHIRPLKHNKKRKLDYYYKTVNVGVDKAVRACAKEVSDNAKDIGYIENNFKKLLARRLRKMGYEVHEEVPVIYRDEVESLPFGIGYVDLVLMALNSATLIELKTTKKTPARQLKKYLKHWDYCNLNGGYCINFVDDNYSIEKIES